MTIRRDALALEGIRILDVTENVAGPYCTLLLAGLGADVVKVEPPGGDASRAHPPFAGDRAHRERSLLFLHLNRAKRSVVLDPGSEGDRRAFKALAASADAILLDGEAAHALALWGVDALKLRGERPQLVITSLAPFGGPGPWSQWSSTELIMGAASGLVCCTGEPDGVPLKTGGNLCRVAHGQTASAATLAALLEAQRGGTGTDVEVSGVEANADLMEMWACGPYQGRPMPRLGRLHNSIYPWHCYRVRDGWVGVHAGPGPWQRFVEMIGAPELASHAAPPDRLAHREEIDAAIERWLGAMSKVEAYHAGQAGRFGFGFVATPGDLVESPHLAERGFFREIDHPRAPGGLYAGPPFLLAGGWRDARAPLLGEHTGEVLAEAAATAAAARTSAARPGGEPAAVDVTQPLRGIRVLDLTQIWAGPRATKVLCDFGADVIKVESPTRTDGTRAHPRYLADRAAGAVASEREHNRRTAFEQLHRGQRSVVLDLRSELGRRAFLELVAASDVVIANFAYGVLERLGVAWRDLDAVNPRIIVLSMTGFGDSGPERDYVAYGVSQEELSGIYALTGYEDGEPLKSGTNIGDPMNGMHGATAVLAALLERERTGRGQYIELSQLEASVGFIGELILDRTVNGRVGGPAGNTHPLWAPHGVYPALGDDSWVALAVRNEREWAAMLDVLDAAELGRDARFADGGARLAHRADLEAELARRTASRERDELASALQGRGVPAAPVLSSVEVQHHPQYEASGYVQELVHPDGGEYRYFGPLWRVDGRRPPVRGPAPLLGEHTREVLETLTGLGRDEVAALDP